MSGPVFPWRSDNRFALLNDGVRFFPRMLLAIEAAQRSIELELYLVEDGHCAELFLVALLDARRRGVAVGWARSEERSVGKECRGKGRTRWSPGEFRMGGGGVYKKME